MKTAVFPIAALVTKMAGSVSTVAYIRNGSQSLNRLSPNETCTVLDRLCSLGLGAHLE